MKKLLPTSLAVAAILSANVASANWMYIDLDTNDYDWNGPLVGVPPTLSALDPDSKTGLFNEFGFSQLLATSIYDYTDGSINGNVLDTNDFNILTSYGIPTTGVALDGVTEVIFTLPDNSQNDIDALSPLTPPIVGRDGEGFLLSWDLRVLYDIRGTFSNSTGPTYDTGYFKVFFNDLYDDSNDRLVLTGTLTGSNIQAANLDLFFDLTYAETNFLWIDNGSGNFLDAAALIASGNNPTLQLDTNVNPPIPESKSLRLLTGDATSPYAVALVRQNTLDGSITSQIPEPSTLALLGLGLAGFGFLGRRQQGRRLG